MIRKCTCERIFVFFFCNIGGVGCIGLDVYARKKYFGQKYCSICIHRCYVITDIQEFFVIIVKILFYLLTFGLYVISILIIRGIMIYISIFYLRGNA